MNPYGDPYLSSGPSDAPGSQTRPPLIQTDHTSLTIMSQNSPPITSDQDGDQNLVQPPSLDHSNMSLPESDPGFSPKSRPLSVLAPDSTQMPSPASHTTPNPAATPQAGQVSVIIPSPELHQSPLPSPCSEDTCPDLECAICFSQFNNVFRCPKMLHCKHTFCLECLARMNVKSAEPNAIQCPLCRSLTPLPTLGLPKLTTDFDVLSYLPAAMQRVYSIRFLRNKGKLEVKRSSQSQRPWGQRPLNSLRSGNRSLDVGLPSPPVEGRGSSGGLGSALYQLTGRPACRAFLLTSVVMIMVMLTAIVIFYLIFKRSSE
ncbi:RING finger protein 225 [Echeneis naucrates]|uniref:RING finger protein 225-like n=1 Tax=Echeneis naucrates TaxID=173247 RepID=A0A665VIS0_ECHNA|nr:RING finger protein 225-like [Echeneis naucrates]XP_029367104.1 RING finger protein 225-like [Echeneis naucrates]XP_029367105.1 RING finger protein 225-like [Echeneis naucrates]